MAKPAPNLSTTGFHSTHIWSHILTRSSICPPLKPDIEVFSEKNEGAHVKPIKHCQGKAKQRGWGSEAWEATSLRRRGMFSPRSTNISMFTLWYNCALSPPRSLHCKCLSSLIQLHVLPQIPLAQRERQSLNLSANMNWLLTFLKISFPITPERQSSLFPALWGITWLEGSCLWSEETKRGTRPALKPG